MVEFNISSNSDLEQFFTPNEAVAREMALANANKERGAIVQQLTPEQIKQTAGEKLKEFLNSIFCVTSAEAALPPKSAPVDREKFLECDWKQTQEIFPEKRLERYISNILMLARDLEVNQNKQENIEKLFYYLEENECIFDLKGLIGHEDAKKCSSEDIIKIIKALKTELSTWLMISDDSIKEKLSVLNIIYKDLINIFKQENSVKK
ncbi:hypothetical protein KAI58_02205 [Candidatus Gracilibacteria bacterium]|nr:hypothetical protein [Candidatus Gracilibacteria bacterium]